MMNITNILNAYQTRVITALEKRLPPTNQSPNKLHNAMHYSVFIGGKRIRPALVYATGGALNVDLAQLDAAACAVELIHTFSLVHDDLPAMDNDDLRRGKPTCHKEFDEATAILVGDALQSLAFECLAENPLLNATQCLNMVKLLSHASGSLGMAGGQ